MVKELMYDKPWIRGESNNYIGFSPHSSMELSSVKDLLIQGQKSGSSW